MNLLLSLHIVLAIFAIGPLASAATTASRGIRRGDATATASAARVARLYANVSVLVVVLGFALMSTKEDGKQIAQFSDTWIWLSLVLWVVAMGLTHGLIAPALDRAGKQITDGQPAGAATTRVLIAGSTVAAIFVVIVFLMVYRPGS